MSTQIMSSISKQILAHAEIPAIPAVLQELQSSVENPDITSQELEKIILKEVGLVAHIFKLVNSAYYALTQKISSLAHAVSILGLSTLKSLASGLMLFNVFKNLSGPQKTYISALWSRSLKSSGIIRVISQREIQAKRDDLFLAGMIHDIGHLILNQHYKLQYDALVKEAFFPSCDREEEVFGINHAQIGADLLEAWQFPARVVQLVKYQHLAEAYPESKKDIHYMTVSDFIADQSLNLEAFFASNEESLDAFFSVLLLEIGWDWPTLQQEKDRIIAAIRAVEEAFPKI